MRCKKLLSNNLSNGLVQTVTGMTELLQQITYLNTHVAQTTSMAKCKTILLTNNLRGYVA